MPLKGLHSEPPCRGGPVAAGVQDGAVGRGLHRLCAAAAAAQARHHHRRPQLRAQGVAAMMDSIPCRMLACISVLSCECCCSGPPRRMPAAARRAAYRKHLAAFCAPRLLFTTRCSTGGESGHTMHHLASHLSQRSDCTLCWPGRRSTSTSPSATCGPPASQRRAFGPSFL